MKIILAVLMVLTMASLSSAQQSQSPADVIFINGDIYPERLTLRSEWDTSGRCQRHPHPRRFTVVSKPSLSPAEKSSLSASNEEIQKLKGPKTQVVDLGGHFVMPGFNDAHVHLGSAALKS